MDRLTFDGNFCDIAQCSLGRCRKDCSQKQTWERLKAYEETGLTPDDIKGHFSEATVLSMAAQVIGTTVDCLREMQLHNSLLGNTVYGIRVQIVRHIGRKIKKHDSFVVDEKILHQWTKDCYVAEKVCTRSDLTRLGKTIFLTKEDAETAIGGQQK